MLQKQNFFSLQTQNLALSFTLWIDKSTLHYLGVVADGASFVDLIDGVDKEMFWTLFG